MKVFDIEDEFSGRQIHSVVAENMAEAERIFYAKYGPVDIRSITLHSTYVQIQGIDEQPKEESI